MLNQRIEKELNKQITAEFFSAQLYLQMSAYFADHNLNGFANWTRIQYQEELTHGWKIYDYIIERGGSVELEALDQPANEWDGPVEVFEEIYKHEQKITSLINNLVEISQEEKDHATYNMLQWFVDEQVEEEANASEILEQLKFVEGKGSGLFMLDRELKSRVFVDETAEEN